MAYTNTDLLALRCEQPFTSWIIWFTSSSTQLEHFQVRFDFRICSVLAVLVPIAFPNSSRLGEHQLAQINPRRCAHTPHTRDLRFFIPTWPLFFIGGFGDDIFGSTDKKFHLEYETHVVNPGSHMLWYWTMTLTHSCHFIVPCCPWIRSLTDK